MAASLKIAHLWLWVSLFHARLSALYNETPFMTLGVWIVRSTRSELSRARFIPNCN